MPELAFVLYNAERYWRSCRHTSYTVGARLKVLKRAVRYAMSLGLTSTDFFITPQLQRPNRETAQRATYAEAELEFIRRTIAPVISFAQKIVAGYKPVGCGSDPRVGQGGLIRVRNSEDDSAPVQTNGWQNWENMVWYFENALGCRAIVSGSELTLSRKDLSQNIR